MTASATDQFPNEHNNEFKAFEEAKGRLHRDNSNAASRLEWASSKLGHQFTRSAACTFAASVHALMNQPPAKGRRMNRSAELLRQSGLDSDTIAYLFTKAIYNSLPLAHRKRVKRVSLSIRAADLIHDEFRIRVFALTKERKNLLKKLFKQFDKRSYPRDWRRRTIMNYFQAEQLDWQAWSTKQKIQIGHDLLVLFRDSTGLIIIEKHQGWVDPTELLLEEYKKACETRVFDYMIYPPMTSVPLPWKEEYLFRGSYLSSKLVKNYPIIKGASRKDVPRFTQINWDSILPAINAIQETPFKIHKGVLEALKWCMEVKGGDIAGLPLANDLPLPPEPSEYRTNLEVKATHNKVCFLIHSENREIKAKRIMIYNAILTAERYQNEPRIFFPHNMDKRGRLYPLPAFLNPQGPDYVKALLEFGQGMPIETDEDACWLAIAGANAYGNDKVTLQERVDWVQNNDEMIFSIANDPYTDLRWTTASEPFQFPPLLF